MHGLLLERAGRFGDGLLTCFIAWGNHFACGCNLELLLDNFVLLLIHVLLPLATATCELKLTLLSTPAGKQKEV